MRRVLSLCSTLLFLAGCAQFGFRARGVAVPVGEVGEALARVARGAEQRTSLRALGRLELDVPTGGSRVDEVVLAQRPDQLRLESLSPLGQAVSVLVTDGERYGYFDGARLESGDLSESTLRERVGLALDVREAVELLLAAPAAASSFPRAAFRIDSELWIELEGWRLCIDPQGELAVLEALDPRGKLRWRARYLGWRDVPGGRYPEALSIEFPRTHVEVRLRLSRVELNASLAAERFRVPEVRR